LKLLIANLQTRAENIQEARAGTVFSTSYPKNTLLRSNPAISIMTICLLGRGSFHFIPCFSLVWVLWLIYGWQGFIIMTIVCSLYYLQNTWRGTTIVELSALSPFLNLQIDAKLLTRLQMMCDVTIIKLFLQTRHI